MAKISKDMIIADLVKIDQNIIPILMREGMHCGGIFPCSISGRSVLMAFN